MADLIFHRGLAHNYSCNIYISYTDFIIKVIIIIKAINTLLRRMP